MLTFKRSFQTRQQAMDVYKTQLSGQKLYVESFEGYPKGTEVRVTLEIRETAQVIELSGTVDRLISKKEVVELGYGQRPGLMLNIPISQELVAPLRAFFLAGAQTAPARQSSQPSPAQVIRPSASTHSAIPFENLLKCSQAEAAKEVDQFLEKAQKASLYQLLNVSPNADRRELRRIYNVAVRVLHPDNNRGRFDGELQDKLADAYQIFNDAYQLLQNPIKAAVYQEVSRQNRAMGGMCLPAYKKWQEDYRVKNSSNIRMADDLAEKAREALARNAAEEAAQDIRLAIQYDPYNELARELM